MFSNNSHLFDPHAELLYLAVGLRQQFSLRESSVRIDRSIIGYSYLHFQELPGGSDSLIELTSDGFIHLPFFARGPIKLIEHLHLLYNEVSLPG